MSPPLTCCCSLLAAATTRAVPCSTPALSAAGLEVLELPEYRQDALVVRLGLESTNASLPRHTQPPNTEGINKKARETGDDRSMRRLDERLETSNHRCAEAGD